MNIEMISTLVIILISLLNNNQVHGALLVNSVGAKNYQQCKAACEELGLRLASKSRVLNYLNSNGGALGGDIWTPILDSDNEWLQIGGAIHQYGKTHSESTGIKPGWGVSITTAAYKKTFYCSGSISFDVSEYSISSRSYGQCSSYCRDTGGVLANRGQILDYLNDSPIGGDSWTPVAGNNNWLQIGGSTWKFRLLHWELTGSRPGWGTSIATAGYRNKFYCYYELQEYDIGNKNYAQCKSLCEHNDGNLASKAEIMAYLDLPKGGDIWTPVRDSDNQWLQIGGSIWGFGKLHTEISTGSKPTWGTQIQYYSFKKTFYCSVS